MTKMMMAPVLRFVGGIAVLLAMALSLTSCASYPLSAAVRSNDVQRTRTLLDAGANVNAGKNVPPLIDAAYYGNVEIVRMLLEKGATVDCQNKHGLTPLNWAAGNGHADVARLLIEHGADVQHVSLDGVPVLVDAASGGNVDIVRMVLDKGAPVDCQNKYGLTPLMWAAAKGHSDVARLLIEHGADVRHVSREGVPVLVDAAYHGHADIVKMLLEKGAPVDCQNKYGITPLMWAASTGNVEVAHLLITHGANVNHANNAGVTALMWASSVDDSYLPLVKLLTESLADVNHASPDGATAFKLACQKDNTDIASYLFENGAATNFEDATMEGIELNGKMNHVLGDYYLARDKLDDSRASYIKARDYYTKAASKYSSDVTKISWQQIGVMALQAMVQATAQAALDSAAQYQGQMQARQFQQIQAMSYATHTRTGIQGYNAYMSKYGSTYTPTYQSIRAANVTPPAADATLEEKKAYAQMKKKDYQRRQELMKKVLECFDQNLSAPELHTAVDAVVNSFNAPNGNGKAK
ncbi:MAG TPA: ankyrin repeat domain-containing protein [Verrucomicrobiae bacterium]|nr:ankyrin repeat domain-containing protein [Verrucomicrobiae bacterium]